MYILIEGFVETITSITAEDAVVESLNKLCSLFGLFWMVKDAADFLEHGIISPAEIRAAKEEVLVLLAELRPIAVSDQVG
jgi:hypothetical protein